jgi:DNA-binding transcriptional LysR family regulator
MGCDTRFEWPDAWKKGVEMELHHLRIFVVVAEEMNLTRGAQRLYMTPPTVSAHIKALEEELGVQLFVRMPHGMSLTEKGKLLKIKAEQTLQAAQEVVNHATALQSQLIGRLRCGLNASPGWLRVAPLVQHMQEVWPGLELELIACSSGSIIDALHQGTMDAGYIFGASPSRSMITHCLGMAEVVVAAPSQWKTRLVDADWVDLAQLPWIGSDGYCPFETLTDDLFRQRGLQYHRVVRSHDEGTKAELVIAGVGLAMLERSEAEQAQTAGRMTIWAPVPLHCPLHFAYLTKRQDDPLIRALRTGVMQVWGKALPEGCE